MIYLIVTILAVSFGPHLLTNFCLRVLIDDLASKKIETGVADGAESDLGNDGLSEKFGKRSVMR